MIASIHPTTPSMIQIVTAHKKRLPIVFLDPNFRNP